MKLKVTAVILGLSAAGLGIAWATGQFDEDPQLKEVKQLQQKLQETVASDDETKSESSREERRELFEQLREKTEALPEEQQSVVQDSMMKFFVSRMEKRVDEFFELPPEERQAALDEHIDRMEERRKSWEQRRQQAESERQGEGGQQAAAGEQADGRGPASGQNGLAASSGGGSGGDSGTSAAGQQAKGKGRGFGGGPPGRRNVSEEQREQWRRRMLDGTTPETRAKFSEFRRLMNERREERGMAPSRF